MPHFSSGPLSHGAVAYTSQCDSSLGQEELFVVSNHLQGPGLTFIKEEGWGPGKAKYCHGRGSDGQRPEEVGEVSVARALDPQRLSQCRILPF